MARLDAMKTAAVQRAIQLGWSAKRNAKGSRVTVRCPHGCCSVVVLGTEAGRARADQVARIERCPGRAIAADPPVVQTDPPPEKPPPPPAPSPEPDPLPDPGPPKPDPHPTPNPTTLGRETPMAKRPDRPEFYELIADYFCENPDDLVSITRLCEALGLDGDDATYATNTLAALHDNTIRRVIGASAERSAANTAYYRFRAAGGLFYRAATGTYVLDTKAGISANHMFTNNQWPVILGQVPRTSKPGRTHPYRNLVEIPPHGHARAAAPGTPDAPADPASSLAEQPPAEPSTAATAAPAVPAVAPTGMVVTLLAGSVESGSIMLRVGDEIVTATVTSTMPVVG